MHATTAGRTFLDTNVLVYTVDSNEPQKQAVARQLLPEIGAALIVILDDMPGALERVDEKAAQAVVILGEKNLCHGVLDFQPGLQRYDLSGVVVKQV